MLCTARVSGAAGGVGQAISFPLLGQCYRVDLVDRDEVARRALACDLGGDTCTLALDVTGTGIIKSRYQSNEAQTQADVKQLGMALDTSDIARIVVYAQRQLSEVQVAQIVVPTNRC